MRYRSMRRTTAKIRPHGPHDDQDDALRLRQGDRLFESRGVDDDDDHRPQASPDRVRHADVECL